MIRFVQFTEEAKADLSESFGFYQSREYGLGVEFVNCVESRIEVIKRHPEMYPIAVDSYRRALVKRFPYELFYEVEDETLWIYAVFHCSQNPEKWKRRLR